MYDYRLELLDQFADGHVFVLISLRFRTTGGMLHAGVRQIVLRCNDFKTILPKWAIWGLSA